MLETIREYALERLEESDEGGALKDRHARFYLAHAVQLDVESVERKLPLDVRRALFEPERTNSLAALEHFRRTGDKLSEAQLATSVLWIDWWWAPDEGRHWLGEAVTYDDVPHAIRARVLWAASRLARHAGELTLDIELNEEQLKVLRLLDAKELVVRTLARLAITSMFQGDHVRAGTALQEAHVVATEVGTDLVRAFVALGEAIVALYGVASMTLNTPASRRSIDSARPGLHQGSRAPSLPQARSGSSSHASKMRRARSAKAS
ncbi:MAG: hypothetical protein ACR2GT_05165 [Gaiellaceae bacterium]